MLKPIPSYLFLENCKTVFLRKFKAYDGKTQANNTKHLIRFKQDKIDALGGDYMIPVCRHEISPRPAGMDLTLRLHVEIKFRSGKAGQLSTWHLFRFACNFFEFFFVNMSVYEIEKP